MNQANITQVRLLNDYDSNGIVLAWPSLYQNEPYWLGLLEIYYQLISDCLQNKKHIILVTKKNISIKKEKIKILVSFGNIDITETVSYTHLTLPTKA